jgi:hypothetical protein
MPDINIKLKGISGPSYDLTIDSEAQTRELYDKVFELIGGQGTGMNLNNLRLIAHQYKWMPMTRKEVEDEAREWNCRPRWPHRRPLKSGEGPQPMSIPHPYHSTVLAPISEYLDGGENVYFVFRMDYPPPEPGPDEQGGGRVRSKRNKHRKSKGRKSKKRKTKKRITKKRRSN